jgi:hypothetical protein
MQPPEKNPTTAKKTKKSSTEAEGKEDKSDESESESGDKTDSEESTEIANKGSEDDFEERMRRMNPLSYSRGSEEWSKLLWGKTKLSRVSKGALGKKRYAMQYGRNPRRIGRLYTDPQRRVFDHERRAKGGIVLIDGSGSMALDRDDVLKILQVAPGATVAIYSDMDEGEGRVPNIHILAKDGKCVEEKDMPDFGAGNGVDFPALDWAIKERKKKEPVVWVTDGGVCVANSGFNHSLAVQCINHAKRHKVICVDHVDSAIKQLQALNNGQTVRVKYPQYFTQVINHLGGMDEEQVVKK